MSNNICYVMQGDIPLVKIIPPKDSKYIKIFKILDWFNDSNYNTMIIDNYDSYYQSLEKCIISFKRSIKRHKYSMIVTRTNNVIYLYKINNNCESTKPSNNFILNTFKNNIDYTEIMTVDIDNIKRKSKIDIQDIIQWFILHQYEAIKISDVTHHYNNNSSFISSIQTSIKYNGYDVIAIMRNNIVYLINPIIIQKDTIDKLYNVDIHDILYHAGKRKINMNTSPLFNKMMKE